MLARNTGSAPMKALLLALCLLLQSGAMARAGEIAGFPQQARYLDAEGREVGVKLEHAASGMPVWVPRTETVPQAFLYFRTLVDSDQGLPHSLEHLLVGKGTKGRLTELLTSMRLGGHGAATAGTETYYHSTR